MAEAARVSTFADHKRSGERLKAPPLAELSEGIWRKQMMIRFSHCDPAGIVYFANYFDIANEIVEDWFGAALALRYHEFIGPRRTGLGFASARCDFVRPCRMGDEVVSFVQVEAMGAASITLMLCGYRGEEPILAMRLVMVTTSITETRAVTIPVDLRNAVETYVEKCRQ